MASLWAFLGLDGSKFKGGLDKARADAASAGKEIQKNLNPKTTPDAVPGGGAGHGGVKSGAMRETLVLMREIGRGNWSRVPGSLSILVSQLGLLKFLFNPITIGVAALAAGFYAAYKWTAYLTEKLSGLKWPEANPEKIARHLQMANQAAEAQKAINKEVEKTIELYYGAAKAAERVAQATKDKFEHERKMNQFAEEKELKGARNEKERAAIRAKFSAKDLQLNDKERAEQLENKKNEEKALLEESAKKQGEANAVKVNSKEHDKELMDQKKKAAEEAQKFLDEELPKRAKDKASQQTISGKLLAQHVNAISPGAKAAMDAARDAKIEEARHRIKDRDDFVNTEADNDEKRKKKEELVKAAAEAKAKAAAAGMEAGDMAKNNPLKAQREKEEADAKLAAENVAKKLSHKGGNDLNALQKIGAYAGRDAMTDSVKSIEKHVSTIAGHHKGGHNHTGHRQRFHVPGFGHH